MRIIRREECDSVDEVQKLFQELFNNQELIEAKVCQMAQKEKKPEKKAKKGFSRMSVVVSLLFVAVFCMIGFAEPERLTYDVVSNPVSLEKYLRNPLTPSGFSLNAGSADQALAIGSTSEGFDITYYFETAGQFRTDYDGDFINLTDDMDLRFGTGASSNGDFHISSNSSNLLTIGQVVAGTGSVAFGVDDAGLDVKMFGDTASAYLLWDTSEDTMEVVGGNATITTDDAEADQFKVDATGTVAGNAIVLETTDGGVQINADGAANGDISIDAADDLTLTAAGDLALAVTGNVTGDATFTGTITMAGLNSSVVTVTDTASYSVTAANTGKVHVLAAVSQETTLALPTEAAGLYYKFIFCGGADESDEFIVDSGSNTNFFIGGVSFADTDAGDAADEINAGVYSDGDSNSKLTLHNLSAGSIVEIYCDGTNWYVSGRIYSDTVPAFADQS